MTFLLNERYLVIGEISKGTMGELYVALDRFQEDKKVALKMVTQPEGEKAFDTLYNEYGCLKNLSHPNIVEIYDFGVDRSKKRFYFTEEFLEGVPLSTRSGQLSLPQILQLTVQICQALAHLHQKGIVHGDLKPSNLLLVGDQVKLVDFGLSQKINPTSGRTIGGTLPYLAPEVLSGGRPTVCSDLYSLGVLLYEITTGHLPFQVTDLPSAMMAHHLETAKHPSQSTSAYPTAWGDLILRLLNKEPHDRPAEAVQIIREINISFGSHFPLETVPSLHRRLSSLPLVGRDKTITELAEKMGRGTAPFIVVQGESGSGRTRLLRELKQQFEDKLPTLSISGHQFLAPPFHGRCLLLIDDFDLLPATDQMNLIDQARKNLWTVIVSTTEWSNIPLPDPSCRILLNPLNEEETDQLLEHALESEAPSLLTQDLLKLTGGRPAQIVSIISDLLENLLIPYEPLAPQLAHINLFDFYETDPLFGFRKKEESPYTLSLKRAIAFYEKLVDQGDENHRLSLAELLYEKGAVDEALTHLNQLKQRGSKSILLSAKCSMKKGDFSAARETLESLSGEKELTPSEQAGRENSTGVLHFYEGNLAEAIPCFQRAVLLYSRLGDKLHTASSENSLANALLRQGKEAEAEQCYRTALKTAREIFDVVGEGSYLMNLGALFQQKREYPKALEHYCESLMKFQRIGYGFEIPRVLNNLANTHLHQGNILRAKELIHDSLRRCHEKRTGYLEAYSLLILGDIHSQEGNLLEAQKNYEAALRIFSILGTSLEITMAEINLLRIYAEDLQFDAFDRLWDRIQAKVSEQSPPSIQQAVSDALWIDRFAKGEFDDQDLSRRFKEDLPHLERGSPEEKAVLTSLERIAKKNRRQGAMRWTALRLGRPGVTSPSRHPLSGKTGPLGSSLLDRLHRLHEMIAEACPTQEIIDLILESVLQLSESDRGLLVLKDGETFSINSTHNLSKPEAEELGSRISSTISQGVFQSGLPALIPNTKEMNLMTQSVADLGLQSVLCLPLNNRGETIGIIYADSKRPKKYHQKLPLLQAFADEATLTLVNARLVDQLRETNHSLKEAQDKLVQGEKLNTLGQMSAGLAHEIASPLAAIRCHAEMLSRDGVKEIQPVIESAEKISQILHQIRFFAGKGRPPLKLMNLSETVERALKNFEPLRNPKVTVKKTFPKRPLWFEGNETMMGQAVANLMTNAQDALSLKGGGTIDVETQEGGNGWIRLTVSDDGPGIPLELREKIFEPFFTTKGEKQPVSGGIGLGLTMILNIIHLHGGKIRVETSPQGGSRFLILLPHGKKEIH